MQPKKQDLKVPRTRKVDARVDTPRPRTNGLEKLAGTWTTAEFEEFEASTAMFKRIDPELWRP